MVRVLKNKQLINTVLATNYGGWMYCENCKENIPEYYVQKKQKNKTKLPVIIKGEKKMYIYKKINLRNLCPLSQLYRGY